MKGKKILCIVLSLVAVFSLLLTRDSVAWFDTYSGQDPSGTIVVDRMAFEFGGSLGTYLQYTGSYHNGDAYTVTEQNLIVGNGGKITVTNKSTIAAEARFKIFYDTPGHFYANRNDNDNTNDAIVYTASDTDRLAAQIDSHWVQKDNDGYFYYYSTLPNPNGQTAEAIAGTEGFLPVALNATVFPSVDAITRIEFVDELYDDDGEPMTEAGGTLLLDHDDYFTGSGAFTGEVHVIFEAKQADHVNWTQITSWATT